MKIRETHILFLFFIALAIAGAIPGRSATLDYVMTPRAEAGTWSVADGSSVTLNNGSGHVAFTLDYTNAVDSYASAISDPAYQFTDSSRGLHYRSWIEGQLCDFDVHFDIGITMTPNNGPDPRDVLTFFGFAGDHPPLSWQIENAELTGWTDPNGAFSIMVDEGQTARLTAVFPRDYVCNSCDPAPVPLPASGWALIAGLVLLIGARSYCLPRPRT